uniref:Uncharacterized protein n=1 Tax=Anguilla anguilla TaxID=7936 RepID=A0A0E9X631_ANGAN
MMCIRVGVPFKLLHWEANSRTHSNGVDVHSPHKEAEPDLTDKVHSLKNIMQNLCYSKDITKSRTWQEPPNVALIC